MLSALAKLRRGSEHKGVVHKSMGSNFQLCRGVFMRQAALGLGLELKLFSAEFAEPVRCHQQRQCGHVALEALSSSDPIRMPR
jgi:hypothetical protein